MAGPDVNAGFGRSAILDGKGDVEDAGYIYDVTPVVLALLGVPIARDMQSYDGGPLLKSMVTKERRETARGDTVRSHDEGFREAAQQGPAVDKSVLEDANRALAELGYLGITSDDEDERTRPPAKSKSTAEPETPPTHSDKTSDGGGESTSASPTKPPGEQSKN